jgi:uncharacterized protein
MLSFPCDTSSDERRELHESSSFVRKPTQADRCEGIHLWVSSANVIKPERTHQPHSFLLCVLSICTIFGFLHFGSTKSQAQDGSASFDCGQAEAPVEHVICSTAQLRSLDGKMSQAYFSRRRLAIEPSDAQKVIANQRQWLRSRRTQCNIRARGEITDEEVLAARTCLVRVYQQRIADLSNLSATTTAVEPTPSNLKERMRLWREQVLFCNNQRHITLFLGL